MDQVRKPTGSKSQGLRARDWEPDGIIVMRQRSEAQGLNWLSSRGSRSALALAPPTGVLTGS